MMNKLAMVAAILLFLFLFIPGNACARYHNHTAEISPGIYSVEPPFLYRGGRTNYKLLETLKSMNVTKVVCLVYNQVLPEK